MKANRIKQIHRELSANRGLTVSRMYGERWSFTGCAYSDGFWLSTEEVRQLWVGGMLEQVSVNGVVWEDDSRFQYGHFRYATAYDIPAYLMDFDSQPCWM